MKKWISLFFVAIFACCPIVSFAQKNSIEIGCFTFDVLENFTTKDGITYINENTNEYFFFNFDDDEYFWGAQFMTKYDGENAFAFLDGYCSAMWSKNWNDGNERLHTYIESENFYKVAGLGRPTTGWVQMTIAVCPHGSLSIFSELSTENLLALYDSVKTKQ